MSSSNNSTLPSTESSSAPASSAALTTSSSVASTSSPVSITSTASASVSSVAPTSSAASSAPSTATPTATSTRAPTSSLSPTSTTTTSLSSSVPPTTVVLTSVVTPTGTDSTGSPQTTVVVITSTQANTAASSTSSASGTGSTTSSAANLQSTSSSGSNKGLSTAGTTAVAVVVPVVVVALLVVAGIYFWRRRKQKKAAEEARRVEVEDYGFNPNNDPTLPVIASESGHEMTEDSSNGYRGWGAAGTASRKMSTTLSGGHTQGQLSSDAGSNAYRGGNSPNEGHSDGHSGDPLMHARRETMNSDDIGALGAAPLAGANQPGVRRGPSNASSTYSAAGHTDVSDDGPGASSAPQHYEAYNPNGYGYSQHGPYGDGSYGGTGQEGGMPIVRDVSARRNTRIQQAGNYQQGGIAQNF